MTAHIPVEYVTAELFLLERVGDTVVVEIQVSEERMIVLDISSVVARELGKSFLKLVCRDESDAVSDKQINYLLGREPEGETT